MKNLFYLLMAGALALGSCGNDDEPEPIAVGSVTLDKTELTFHRGESATLTATVVADDAVDKSIAWRSSNTNVATVNDKGLVSAVEPGTATITATGGGKSASCTVTVEPDVYVVGWNGTDLNTRKGILWKNGVAQELPLQNANSLFVSDGDVYIAGNYRKENVFIGGVWKNGVLEEWESGNYAFSSVFVSGRDIYVAGNAGANVAYLWVNGTQKRLTEVGITSSAASVFVSGQDVYAAGRSKNGTTQFTATYWKNGVANDLTDGTNVAALQSLIVAKGTVYAAGQDNSKAVLWEGGKRIELPEGVIARSVAVSEKGDVYVAGESTNNRPALWKNGELTELNTESDDATSVFIYGDDIYVAGGNQVSKAKLWINGKETILPEGTYATSVFVY